MMTSVVMTAVMPMAVVAVGTVMAFVVEIEVVVEEVSKPVGVMVVM